MSQRLKVLISAYACEPGKGSEPEVGWQWALQMARFHDVTVVTRTNNRPAIESALATLRGQQPLPVFVYHDRGSLMLDFKRRAHAIKLYYLLWQRSAWELIDCLHKVHRYDLMHHVTFAGFRYPTAVWGHGVPSIWGPIGGIESIPLELLPWHHPPSLLHELLRNANNVLQATPFHVLPKRARATTLILTSTPEMWRTFQRLGFSSTLMPTIGLSPETMPRGIRRAPTGPLKILFVGNIITLKGVDLALDAVKASETDATFTLIGGGNYLTAAKQRVQRLGLSQRVKFLSRVPREELLKLYSDYDVFLLPSLHDTGGYSVIEAMLNELPVICLDCGGPAVAVEPGCGVKVSVGARAKIVEDLAAAIRNYDRDRALLHNHGETARAAILHNYNWETKGVQMNQRYHEAIALYQEQAGGQLSQGDYPGMGRLTPLLHHTFSMRGVAVAVAGMLLVGTLGFLSVQSLKTDAGKIVNDTLPGLSYAGAADASLAQGFNRTLLFLICEDQQRAAKLRGEIEDFSQTTTQHLTNYQNSIYDDKDRRQFNLLWERRREYIEIRTRVFALADGGRKAEALAVCEKELTPAYVRYKESADRLFDYNMRQGQSRGKNILVACTVTQLIVAAIVVSIFVIGFLIGLFK